MRPDETLPLAAVTGAANAAMRAVAGIKSRQLRRGACRRVNDIVTRARKRGYGTHNELWNLSKIRMFGNDQR